MKYLGLKSMEHVTDVAFTSFVLRSFTSSHSFLKYWYWLLLIKCEYNSVKSYAHAVT